MTSQAQEKSKPEYLRLYMRCQLCPHTWEIEEYGFLYDIMMKITGCPKCDEVSIWTNRPSLEALKFERIDNPYAVSGEFH